MSPAVAHAPLNSLNSPHAPSAPAGTERPGYTYISPISPLYLPYISYSYAYPYPYPYP